MAVRSLLKRNSGLWFGWSGTVSADEEAATREVREGGLSYVLTDLGGADYQESMVVLCFFARPVGGRKRRRLPDPGSRNGEFLRL